MMETDPQRWMAALRTSHDRLRALAGGLDGDGLRQRSYAAEWSIAQVLSHLGSQAEIFDMFLDSALHDAVPPGAEEFGPIWERWNAKKPEDQAAEALVADGRLVVRVESLDPDERGQVRLELFGRELDLAGLLQMRLSEHALHSWDVAVALDDDARLSPEAVDLLIDTLGPLVGRTGRSLGSTAVAVRTTQPERLFRLESADGKLTLVDSAEPTAESSVPMVSLPAEAFVRLIYGRLGADNAAGVQVRGIDLDELRESFPGF
jgi:uncharacterized protein (TIGR03083 family)